MYEVVWPRGNSTEGIKKFAKRLDTLEGKTVGFLWNWLFHGDQVFPMIEKELTKRYPGIKFVSQNVFGPTSGANEAEVIDALPVTLKQNKVDAVISGIGC